MVNDKVTVSNIIEIRNLSFGYKYHDPIIDGVSLDIPRGRFIGLLGPSGAGKTTLLKLILGLNKPWNGNIKFGIKNDRDKSKEFPSIGYSPQAESVDWDFPITVTELVSMGLWNASGVFPWINNNTKKRIRLLLDELEIGKYHNRQIRELSGGEQKRVFLARALINNPDLLILDEPTSGLDPLSREKIIQKLIEINNSGITIMITTHDIDGVAKKIPWVICLNRQIVSQGNPNVILSENTIYKTYGLKE